MANISELLGKRIRELRTKSGLSQERLAELAGFSGKYLGEVERGEGNISIQLLARIADVLGLSLTALLESGHEASREEILENIMSLLESSSDAELKTVYRVIASILQ